MAKRKYLLDSEIKVGHWYIDQKGCKKLYLGVAQQIYGAPHFSNTRVNEPAHLYAKYNELEKYFGVNPNAISMKEIADTLLFKLAYTHPAPYYGYSGHHKFVSECGCHPDNKIAPDVLSNPGYTFTVAFYDVIEDAKPEGRYREDGSFVDDKPWFAMQVNE